MTQTDGEMYHVLELKGSILWKWLYYSKQLTDSLPSLSNYQRHFSQNWNEKFYNIYGNTKDPKVAIAILKKKMKMEELTCLNSDCTTKLQ